MPKLFIHARNADFESRDDGADYDRPEDALAHGVRSALAIVADEIHQGKTSTAVEVNIEREDGTLVSRSVVALSVSPLFLTPQA